MPNGNPVNFAQQGASILTALTAVEEVIGAQGIEPRLHHLVQLRASQMNKCAFCVKMHTRDARRDGETNDRLDRLVVWRHVGDFTPREKAAFAWTEALTEPRDDRDLTPLRAELRLHFSEAEISTLTGIVAMINLWNRIQLSHH
jgi:AhpD family alkylhydroperoxidase